jgi:hypothetical protein
VAVKNGAISLKTMTIKCKGQLTKLFSKKNKNMVVLAWAA